MTEVVEERWSRNCIAGKLGRQRELYIQEFLYIEVGPSPLPR
jgi:hypothetical protein